MIVLITLRVCSRNKDIVITKNFKAKLTDLAYPETNISHKLLDVKDQPAKTNKKALLYLH